MISIILQKKTLTSFFGERLVLDVDYHESACLDSPKNYQEENHYFPNNTF